MADSLQIDQHLALNRFQKQDAPQLVALLDCQQIYQTTLSIPSPYRMEDAQNWIDKATEVDATFKQPVQWAVRNEEGKLLGGIGLSSRRD